MELIRFGLMLFATVFGFASAAQASVLIVGQIQAGGQNYFDYATGDHNVATFAFGLPADVPGVTAKVVGYMGSGGYRFGGKAEATADYFADGGAVSVVTIDFSDTFTMKFPNLTEFTGTHELVQGWSIGGGISGFVDATRLYEVVHNNNPSNPDVSVAAAYGRGDISFNIDGQTGSIIQEARTDRFGTQTSSFIGGERTFSYINVINTNFVEDNVNLTKSWTVSGNVSISAAVPFGGQHGTVYASESVDFLHTVSLDSITLPDFGNVTPESLGITITTESGLPFSNAVPEPSTIILAAFGLVGLVAWGWRRRKS